MLLNSFFYKIIIFGKSKDLNKWKILQLIPMEHRSPAPVFTKNENINNQCMDYSEIRYCVGFKTKNYMTTEKSTFINKLIQNKNKHECICELLDCSGNTYYHPYFDIEHYDNDTTIEFNIDTTLEFICHQFGVNRNDIALSSDIKCKNLGVYLELNLMIIYQRINSINTRC